MSILRWWWSLVLAFALVALVRVFLPLPFANEIMIFSIYTIGCNFLLGRVGFISFGQPAYLAIGAYAAAFYFYYFGTNPYVGILIGIAAGIVMSLAVGPMFVRLRSDYFALVNLALAVIVFYLMQKVLADITHGDNGLWFLTNLSSTPVLDLTRPDRFFIFAFLLGFAVVTFILEMDVLFDYLDLMVNRGVAPLIVLQLFLLSLGGIPFVAGFWAKLYVFLAAAEQGLYWLVLLGAILTVVALFYYLAIAKQMYIERPLRAERVPLAPTLATAILIAAVGVVALGVYPKPVVMAALRVAAPLF